MSRELLRRVLAECADDGSISRIDYKLYGEIAEYLETHAPEPVAWVTIDRSEHKRCQMVRLSQAVLDEYDLKQYPLYAEPVDQSERIASLAKDSVRQMETITDLRQKISELKAQREMQEEIIKTAYARCKELEQQLAALQAERKPLSVSELVHLAIKTRSTFNVEPFARAIEQAHGITDANDPN